VLVAFALKLFAERKEGGQTHRTTGQKKKKTVLIGGDGEEPLQAGRQGDEVLWSVYACSTMHE